MVHRGSIAVRLRCLAYKHRHYPWKHSTTCLRRKNSTNSSKSFKPSITQLLQNLQKLPPNTLPPTLVSTLQNYAAREIASSTSGITIPNNPETTIPDEYEQIKLQCSTFINNYIQSGMNMRNNTQKGTSESAYSPKILNVYDTFVWQFNAPFLWNISQSEVQSLYEQCIPPTSKQQHCEVAVGTGLFLSNLGKNRTPSDIDLLDLNRHSLFVCAERLKERARKEESLSMNINQYLVDVMDAEAIPSELRGKHTSVAANFLLHCLHGDSLLEKGGVIQGCSSLLSLDEDDEACFFGSTILGGDLLNDDAAGEAALQTMELYNDLGIFGNKGDTFEDLEIILRESFDNVEVWKSGYCGVWKARKPKR